MEMGRQGRKRQLLSEDEYWKLILSGVGTVEACRLVGITLKTGYRWRAERGGVPPLRLAETERGTRYLSLLERLCEEPYESSRSDRVISAAACDMISASPVTSWPPQVLERRLRAACLALTDAIAPLIRAWFSGFRAWS